MESQQSNDHFAQLASVEVVRMTAKLIAQMLTLNGAYTPNPNLGEVFTSELARELQRLGVPNKVAATMVGVSLSTLHRVRRKRGMLGQSVVTATFRTLADGPLSKPQILLKLHDCSAEIVTSTLWHLVSIGAVERNDDGDFYIADGTVDDDDTVLSGLPSILVFVIAEGCPRTADDLALISGQPLETVHRKLSALQRTGWLEKHADGTFYQGKVRDYRVGSGASTLVSWAELTRVILGSLRERLARADAGRKESPGILSIRFDQSYFERVNERFLAFQDEIVSLWRNAAPPDGTGEEAVFFLGGVSNMRFEPIDFGPEIDE